MIDSDAFEHLVDGYFVSAVLAATEDGSPGLFKRLLTVIRKLYRAIEPSSVKGSITVFARMEADAAGNSGTFQTLGALEDLRAVTAPHVCLEVLASGDVRRWNISDLPNLAELSDTAVVYSFQAGAESFWVNGKQFEVPNVYAGTYSLFQLPAYRELEQALAKYRHPIVRLSQCEILSDIWFDDFRLFLKAKPEATMRRSLTRFLRWTLGSDTEVMPEQNVDETHPIDIRVTFNFPNRVALIEIKWLGHSKDANGKPTTFYSKARAKGGASQLAKYLDWFGESLPDRIARGYLVVFDCRRRRLTSNPATLDSVDGLYFADLEIDYDPPFHLERGDFAEPIRMFAEPICD